MKTRLFTIALLSVLSLNLVHANRLVVQHEKEGIILEEIVIAMATTGIDDAMSVTELVVITNDTTFNSLNLDDCTPFRDMFAGAYLDVLDLSGVTFRSYSMPEGTTSQMGGAFSGMNMSAIAFPENLVRIGQRGFLNCVRLKSIDLPESLEIVGAYAFQGCTSVTGNITFPATMKTIGNSSFLNCNKVTSLTFKGTESVGPRAFRSCKGLEEIIFEMNTPPTINMGESNPDDHSFSNISPEELAKIMVYVPVGTKQFFNKAPWNTMKEIVEGKPTSINNVAKESAAVLYPAIAKETIYLNGLENNQAATIYSVSGQAVASIALLAGQANEISVSHLHSGLYFLKIEGRTFKFIKE